MHPPQDPTHRSLLLKRLGEYGGGMAMPLSGPSAPRRWQRCPRDAGSVLRLRGGDAGTGYRRWGGVGVTSAVLNCPFQGPACHPELGSGRVKGALCDSPRDAAARGRTRLVAPCRGPPVVGAHPAPVPGVLGCFGACFGAPLPGESGKSGLPPAPQHRGKPPRIAPDGSHLGRMQHAHERGRSSQPTRAPPHTCVPCTRTQA